MKNNAVDITRGRDERFDVPYSLPNELKRVSREAILAQEETVRCEKAASRESEHGGPTGSRKGGRIS